MNRVCVIGLGSPHGDDRAGWEVIKLLEAEFATARHTADGVELVAATRAGGELLELWKDAALAIVVDAVRSGAAPGTHLRLELHPVTGATPAFMPPALTSHGLGVVQLLELGRVLNVLPQRLILHGVEVADCMPLAALSAPVRAALPVMAQAVMRDLRSP